MLFEQCLETRSIEHLAPGVMGLYQAITIEEEALSRSDGDLILLVTATGQHPKRHTCGPEFRDAIAATPIWQVLPCIGVEQPPAFGIEQCIEASDKHPR